MKKQLHILEGIIILTFIFIASLLAIRFIYHINHEKLDTSYMLNINFDNLRINEGSKEGTAILENNMLFLDVTLNNEKEFFEVSVNIENTGTLNAILDIFEITNIKENNVLTYKITYLDGQEIKKNDLLKSHSKETIIIRIDYPKQDSKVYEALELSVSLKMQYKAIY